MATLLNATDAGANVYNTKVTQFFEKDLPAISIVTPNEYNDFKTGGSSRVTDTLRLPLMIAVAVKALPSENIGDILDDLCEQVMGLIDPKLGGLCQDASYKSTETTYDTGGENTVATAVMTYDVLFMND